MDDAAYLAEDARDRRAALAFAQSFVYVSPARDQFEWPPLADEAYRWLQQRDSLRAASISLIAGTRPGRKEIHMTATLDLSDTDEATFTLRAATRRAPRFRTVRHRRLGAGRPGLHRRDPDRLRRHT